jgi:hypothetical protein
LGHQLCHCWIKNKYFRNPHRHCQCGEWPHVNVYTRLPNQCLILLAHYVAWGESQIVQSSTWLYPIIIIMSFNLVFLFIDYFHFLFSPHQPWWWRQRPLNTLLLHPTLTLLITCDSGTFINCDSFNCTLTHIKSTCNYSDRWLLKVATSHKSHYTGLPNE